MSDDPHAPVKRTVRLVGGPRGEEFREVAVLDTDERLILPVIPEIGGMMFEEYRRTGDCDFEFADL